MQMLNTVVFDMIEKLDIIIDFTRYVIYSIYSIALNNTVLEPAGRLLNK